MIVQPPLPLALYRGCTMGMLRSSETAKTSASRCVRSRWALSWCSEKSALRTKILAISQSYSESVGTKMGLSAAGICFSCVTGMLTWFSPFTFRLPGISYHARSIRSVFSACIWPNVVVVSPGLRWASACLQEFCARALAEPSGTASSHWWCWLLCRPVSCSHTGICCLSAPNKSVSNTQRSTSFEMAQRSVTGISSSSLNWPALKTISLVTGKLAGSSEQRRINVGLTPFRNWYPKNGSSFQWSWTYSGQRVELFKIGACEKDHFLLSFKVTVHESTWYFSPFAAKHSIDAVDISPVLLAVVQSLQLQLSQSTFQTTSVFLSLILFQTVLNTWIHSISSGNDNHPVWMQLSFWSCHAWGKSTTSLNKHIQNTLHFKKSSMVSPNSCRKKKLCILGEGEANLTRQGKRAFSLHDVGNSLCKHIPAGRKEHVGEAVWGNVECA